MKLINYLLTGEIMAKNIKIKEIGELIGEKPFEMNWFSYDLGGGWGQKLTRYRKKGAAQGIFVPGIGNENGILKVYKKLKNNDFSDIAGFYVGILAFFGEKIYENLEFVEKVPKNSLNTIVATLKCPERFKNEIYEICYSEYDFLDFIKEANRLPTTVFDAKSVISVYNLQGKKAIYPLLCQMFYVNKGISEIHASLINDAPIDYQVKISDFFSGCHFPVCVSPSVTKFKWEENANGWFLYGFYCDEWVVIDVVGAGRVNLSNYVLANRLNYWGNGGKTIPYLICWNWGEIIDAYHYFSSDLLIRDLNNTFFDNYWFNFGLNSKINVHIVEGYINSDKDLQIHVDFNSKEHGVVRKNNYITTNLNKDFIQLCDKEDVIFSDSEIFDILEIGDLLKM